MPAVAVIRRRQVLFIFNRYKGYLDRITSPEEGTSIARVLYEKRRINRGKIKFYYTSRTGNGKGDILCKN